MMIMLWRKHWMELRGLWLFAAVMAGLPALLLRVNHVAYAPKLANVFIATFAIFGSSSSPALRRYRTRDVRGGSSATWRRSRAPFYFVSSP